MSATTLKTSSSSPVEVPGWYGKLPSLGDFASRRLPDAFVHAWDDWLQHGLAEAQAWREAADRDIVPHRFWVGPRVLSDSSWVGVLAPSKDRVGRRFPLTIAAPLAADTAGLASALAARRWYAVMEDVARRAPQAQLALGDLESELTAAAAAASPSAEAGPGDQQLAAEVLRTSTAAGNRSRAGATSLHSPQCSVWWRGDAAERSQFLCVAALPMQEAFAWLLTKAPSSSPAD